ncbi:hypothetical protein ACGFMO_18895 [Streptomyces niveus]|uniref:hypothetical protein n=1 Tax=Streptomyces niveus TaxID=193462 RepID=UPI00371837CA
MRGWKRTALIAGSCALIAAMVVVWTVVDLGTADGVASVVGASVGVVGIVYALIGGAEQRPSTFRASRTGKSTARRGGASNTGITRTGSGGPVQASATDTGDAEADCDGSGANSGIQLS